MSSTEKFRIKSIDRSMIAELIDIGELTRLSRWTAQNYLDEIALESSMMYCVPADDGSILGFVVGRLVPGVNDDELMAEIYNIAVRPELQGTGVAQYLMEYFAATAAKTGVVSIWLEVRESNARAIAFYRKFGFSEISRRPGYYAEPREAAIVMQLDIIKIES